MSTETGRTTASVARTYSTALASKPREYWDYESFRVEFGLADKYQLVSKLGRGKYSEVFHAINVVENKQCAIKILKAIRVSKIQREIKILQNLRDAPNTIQILDVLMTGSVAIVTELVHNINYRYLYPTLDSAEIQYYLYQLLLAVDYAHSNGIMHRDIKPQNVMIDPNRRILRLADWGLAEFYHMYGEYNVRVASRYFKAPELLLNYTYYDYSVDMWSFGCMLAGLIFQKEPFFQGGDNDDQMVCIVKVLGVNGLRNYATKYSIPLEAKLMEQVERHQQIPWENFVRDGRPDIDLKSALDLTENILKYDHVERLTAKEALCHSYFRSMRTPVPPQRSDAMYQNLRFKEESVGSA